LTAAWDLSPAVQAAFPGLIPVQQCLIQQLTRLKLVLIVVIDANCMLIVVPIVVVDAIVTLLQKK
jgi:hypothetical protein